MNGADSSFILPTSSFHLNASGVSAFNQTSERIGDHVCAVTGEADEGSRPRSNARKDFRP